jgi:hypothetical protein
MKTFITFVIAVMLGYLVGRVVGTRQIGERYEARLAEQEALWLAEKERLRTDLADALQGKATLLRAASAEAEPVPTGHGGGER